MDQLSAEKRLSLAYLLVIAAGAASSISTGVAWSHWYRTLDQCVGRNCSCIIYGTHTMQYFLGGGQAPCIWVTFGPLIYLFFTIGLICFHGYRVLFTTKSPSGRSTRTMLAKLDTGESVQIEAISQETTSHLPTAYWIIVSTITSFFTIYSLIHFIIYLDGYYHTCNQYRSTLERLLSLHGSALPVIHQRLSCSGIFDFMDYMQTDSGNAYRDGIINTGACLIIGIVSSFFSWTAFLSTSVINIMVARRNNE
ncbi:uncharacterized protein LOC130902770 [Diorhabda carinulata]|uniref:uncharacterized protein LOC130902770 n=1 Tax=Diorhabda carinulata TaxID=1163345 RepID=UPI0024E0D162|nr:uncharacterized protein LOC130440856 isoform X1 [Diorhabda sublineata]XP_056630206.1 uncharacterized protein LOC130440856 isoform X1 [Diorhabda sublineata]XP_057671035.1 uncharacterized protein LOC130902770 [Diorhabda carinulata]